jgi:hypothetical protein
MIQNTQFEVLTPSGWRDFDGIAASRKRVVRVQTSVGVTRTSTKHRVIINGREKYAVSLKPGDVLAPGISVVSVRLTDDYDVLYDLVNVGGGNVYKADGYIHHNCEFQGSAGTLISGEKLQKLTWSEPIYRTDDNVMRMYKRPKKDHKYVMTVDVSEGVDRDYSVASVFDVTTKPFRHVAMYRCNSVAPEVFTSIINQLGRQYNDAVAIVETNSIGAAVAKDLWFEFEYENVLKTVTRDTGAKVGYGSGSVLGVRTTKATKRQGCSTLKSLIETDLLITEDYDAIHEFGTFIAHGSSWAAEEGKTDDVVMTFVIFAWFTQQVTFEEYMAGSMNSELRKAREDETMGALAAFLDGPDDFMDGDEDLSLVA